MALDKDLALAIATPGATLLCGYLFAPLFWLLPALLYVIYRRYAWQQAREVALRLTDLNLSLLVLGIAGGLLLGAVGSVLRDAEVKLPLDSLLALGVALLLGLYTLISYGFITLRALQRRPHQAWLNMGMLEALRGKR